MTTATARRAHLTDIPQAELPSVIAGRRSVLIVLAPDARPPHGGVTPGDLVYLRSGPGQPCAGARVARVDEFDDLGPAQVRALLETFGPRLIGPKPEADADDRFATVVWLADVRPVLDASRIPAGLSGPSAAAWRTTEPPEARDRRAA